MKKILIISMFSVLCCSALLFIIFQKSETLTLAQSVTNLNTNCQSINANQTNTSSNTESNQCDFSKYTTYKIKTGLKIISLPKPKYPKGNSLNGVVEVKILIGKDGNIHEACAVGNTNDLKKNVNRLKDSLLIQAAEEAALKIKVDVSRQSFFGKDFFEMIVTYNFIK